MNPISKDRVKCFTKNFMTVVSTTIFGTRGNTLNKHVEPVHEALFSVVTTVILVTHKTRLERHVDSSHERFQFSCDYSMIRHTWNLPRQTLWISSWTRSATWEKRSLNQHTKRVHEQCHTNYWIMTYKKSRTESDPKIQQTDLDDPMVVQI